MRWERKTWDETTGSEKVSNVDGRDYKESYNPLLWCKVQRIFNTVLHFFTIPAGHGYSRIRFDLEKIKYL